MLGACGIRVTICRTFDPVQFQISGGRPSLHRNQGADSFDRSELVATFGGKRCVVAAINDDGICLFGERVVMRDRQSTADAEPFWQAFLQEPLRLLLSIGVGMRRIADEVSIHAVRGATHLSRQVFRRERCSAKRAPTFQSRLRRLRSLLSLAAIRHHIGT